MTIPHSVLGNVNAKWHWNRHSADEEDSQSQNPHGDPAASPTSGSGLGPACFETLLRLRGVGRRNRSTAATGPPFREPAPESGVGVFMRRQVILTIVGITASCVGLFLLYRVFQKNDLREVLAVVASVPPLVVIIAVIFTACSFLCIIVLESLAVRYAGQPVSAGRVVATSIAAIGVGHAIGLAALSSGAVRYRMYSHAGMNLFAVGKVVVFSGISVASGYALVGGAALLWRGEFLAPLLGFPASVIRGFAAAILVALLIYILLCAFLRRTATIRRHRFRLPSLKLALGQVVASSVNLLCVAAVLYMALQSFASVDYPVVAMLYVGSDMSAVIGHVPGGWGLLEFIITSALSEEGHQVLSGVILFRAIYYLLPLLVGLLVFLADELRRRHVKRAGEPAACRT